MFWFFSSISSKSWVVIFFHFFKGFNQFLLEGLYHFYKIVLVILFCFIYAWMFSSCWIPRLCLCHIIFLLLIVFLCRCLPISSSVDTGEFSSSPGGYGFKVVSSPSGWMSVQTRMVANAGCVILPPVSSGWFGGGKVLLASGQGTWRGKGGVEDPPSLTSLPEAAWANWNQVTLF